MLEVPVCRATTQHAGNAPGRRPSPLSVPAAFLRRHAIMASLAALPLLVFGAAAVSRPAPAPPVPVKLVQTEGVRVIRMDSVTFRTRWMPVYDMPLAVARIDERQTVGATVSAHRESESFREVPVRVLTRTPPATEVRYRTSRGGEGEVAGTVTGAAHPTALPPRHRLRSRSASLDICARHNMRKVHYGKRWRCRR